MNLKVENLANIKEAEVEIKNLTLFVGQNSTHKSYMAHVVYELFKEINSLSGFMANWNKRNKIISSVIKNLDKEYYDYFESLKRKYSEDFLSDQISEDEWEESHWTIVDFEITNQNYFKEIINNLNKSVLEELTKIINQSFNTNSTIIDNILIDISKYNVISENSIKVHFDIPLEYFEESMEEIINKLLTKLINISIDNLNNILDSYKTSYYFPASRTGFVLTLDEIYAGIFRDKFRGQISSTRLGEPTIDFIQTFADLKTGKIKNIHIPNFSSKQMLSSIQKLIVFMEQNIIKGKIKEVKNEQDYSTYYLNINDIDLDLHLASSATLETLPFIVFIKNTKDISKTFFVIEEPEAHLHPKAQIQMAKFIVMLSNMGAKVLVTTHSDYILGEINNCIKEYELNNKDDFSISQDSVSAYLFKNQENNTLVNKLKIDKFGIANDNFDEALDELLEKSGELSDKILQNE